VDSVVGVSACFVAAGRVGGAEFMLYNVVRGLSRHVDGLHVYYRAAYPLATREHGVRYQAVPGVRTRFGADSVAAVGHAHRAILFPNYFTPPVVRGSSVTVIHDAQYLHYPQYFSRRKRIWLRSQHRRTLRRSDAVVAISEFVRSDLVRGYGAAAARVTVIPNPIDFTRFDAVGKDEDAVDASPGEYVLSVGAGYPHKNVATLSHGFHEYRRHGGSLNLVLVGRFGRGLLGARIEAAGEIPEGPGLHLAGHVGDRQLGRLYRSARAVVLPSTFEGFGMPVAEALGLGLPVVASRIPAVEEVSFGLANLCDAPLDELAWTRWLWRVERGDVARPSSEESARVRATYDPGCIGAAYARLLADAG
jgi:glycosyltransferase involved in cell wall biosynthesis